MERQQFQKTIERTRKLLDWDNASPSAREWWEELELLNKERSDLVTKLADQLLVRDATIDDFFLACSYSGREGVKENLKFLDVIHQDKTPKEKAVEALKRSCGKENVVLH